MKKTNQTQLVQYFLWAILFCLLGISFAGYIFFMSPYSNSLKIAYWLVTVVVLCGLFFLTASSTVVMLFLQETRFEFRKVTWPSRQEALQTNFVVLVLTVLISLLLWFIDSILFYIITALTTQR
jgi:preprotein translocase subunit SecE